MTEKSHSRAFCERANIDYLSLNRIFPAAGIALQNKTSNLFLVKFFIYIETK
jgi:hypothetical protein